jgi:hydroxymethylbilane synthase
MTTSSSIKVGTRGSLLATTQSQWVIDRLQQACPGLEVEVITITTTGDIQSQKDLPQPLSKGLFTKEIENALLAGDIDLAIHSLKDLPTELPTGLALGAVPPREDPSDAMVGKTIADIASDFAGYTIGTSSLRRAAQLRARYEGCRVVDLRGNVDTRLRKVKDGVVDCAVMAAAGLKRLGYDGEIAELLDFDDMLPAPAQGALGIEIREDDDAVRETISRIHCAETSLCTTAERSFLQQLASGCRAPVAALATVADDTITLKGRVIDIDGSQTFAGLASGSSDKPAELGRGLADQLIAEGAGELLQRIMAEVEQNG